MIMAAFPPADKSVVLYMGLYRWEALPDLLEGERDLPGEEERCIDIDPRGLVSLRSMSGAPNLSDLRSGCQSCLGSNLTTASWGPPPTSDTAASAQYVPHGEVREINT